MTGSGRIRSGSKEPSPPNSLCLASLLSRSAQITFQPLLDLAARSGADLLRDGLAILEQQHGRNATHAVAARRVGVLVNVDLGDRDLVAQLGRDFFQRGGDHPARAAPFRPE